MDWTRAVFFLSLPIAFFKPKITRHTIHLVINQKSTPELQSARGDMKELYIEVIK